MKWQSIAYSGLALFAAATQAQGPVTNIKPVRPPSIPLAVRSPYLNVWLQAGASGTSGSLTGQWPTFWNGAIMGWSGLIWIDGETYTWMGTVLDGQPPAAEQVAVEWTATRSIFTINVANKVSMNVTFTSPIFPDDLQRQSLSMSYMHVLVTATDDTAHEIYVYTDITAEWASGDRTQTAAWSSGVQNSIYWHGVGRQTQLEYTEASSQAEWGDWYYVAENYDGTSFMQATDKIARGAFATNPTLDGSLDTTFRTIGVGQDFPVFAYSTALGLVADDAECLFAIGGLQQNVVQYAGPQGYTPMPALWKSYFSSEGDAIEFFFNDYEYALNASTVYDAKLAKDANAAGGPEYVITTALAARQAYAGLHWAGTKEKPYAFFKEMGPSDDMQTADAIFPTSLAFLYSNPELLPTLLNPLLEHQGNGLYPNEWAMSDLGTAFPNATGHAAGDTQNQPVEATSNMLIMSLAYAQSSGNVDWLKTWYPILKQWGDWLGKNTLYPADQYSVDDYAGSLANQTNLALKGILGVRAFGEIANLTGNTTDCKTNIKLSKDYIKTWLELSVASKAPVPHTMLSYGDVESDNLLYNLYIDKLLGFNLVPQNIYDMQSKYYMTVSDDFGVPLDSRHTYTRADWSMLTAAVADAKTKPWLVKLLSNWIAATPSSYPFGDLFEPATGLYQTDYAYGGRPVVGGTYALLALNRTLAKPPAPPAPPKTYRD